ncbi:hypothetical protein GIB67_019555, partial [Kingdonia uniflora]
MSMKVLQAQSNSSKLASKAISNHWNIAIFSVEKKIMGLFEVTLEEPKRESQKQSWYAGLELFITQFLTATNIGLILWYGGLSYYMEQSPQIIFVGLSLKVQPMTIVALVGQSGSGKSTIIGLIQRLFDPLSSKVTYCI